MVAFLFNMTFDDVAFALPLEGRRSLPVTTGDGLVVLAMLLFYIEVLKMARLARKTFMVEWPGGLSPPGSPRTVREPLDSYGSCCSAVSMT